MGGKYISASCRCHHSFTSITVHPISPVVFSEFFVSGSPVISARSSRWSRRPRIRGVEVRMGMRLPLTESLYAVEDGCRCSRCKVQVELWHIVRFLAIKNPAFGGGCCILFIIYKKDPPPG